MGALTDVYVAFTSGSDGTGNGTSGNPYKTTQFLLNNHGRDTANGNYINLSGDDVLAATLNKTTWGTPTSTAPTVIRNWVGGPDGTGGLNGNAGNFQIANNLDFFSYSGIKLHNTGTATIVTIKDGMIVEQCEIYDSSNVVAISVSNQSNVIGNNLYGCGRISSGFGSFVGYNFSLEGAVTWGSAGAIYGNQWGTVLRNIVVVTQASSCGMWVTEYCRAINNSILQTVAGTDAGIRFGSQADCIIANNLIEGFSGAGGRGMYQHDTTQTLMVKGNAVYNCTTAYTVGDVDLSDDNETLGATPFAKSGSNTFANRFTYFASVDTGNVWGKAASGAYPVGSGLDKGAVQHIAVGGGGGGRPEFRGANL